MGGTKKESKCFFKSPFHYRERQIPYVFILMWILRNLTEDHGGGEGAKKKKLQRGKEANHETLKNRIN